MRDLKQVRPEKALEFKNEEFLKNIPEDYGKGEIKSIVLRKGLHVGVMNSELKRNLVTKLNNDEPLFGLMFSLSGKTNLKVNCLKDNLNINSRENRFFYFPGMSGDSVEKAGERVQRIMIGIDPFFFMELIGDDKYGIPDEVRKVLDKKEFNPFNITDTITLEMQLATRQIIDCRLEGLSRKLFIESRVLELLVHVLEQLKSVDLKSDNSLIKSDDLEKIYELEKYLLENIKETPDLYTLAGKAGMSRTKLLFCFSKIFGVTPTVYVRNKRFEIARNLLKHGKTNVTEAAYLVGYSNLSHFSEMFKKYYGILPSEAARKKSYPSL